MSGRLFLFPRGDDVGSSHLLQMWNKLGAGSESARPERFGSVFPKARNVLDSRDLNVLCVMCVCNV